MKLPKCSQELYRKLWFHHFKGMLKSWCVSEVPIRHCVLLLSGLSWFPLAAVTREHTETSSFVLRHGWVDQNPRNSLKSKPIANHIVIQCWDSYNCNCNLSVVLQVLLECYHLILNKKPTNRRKPTNNNKTRKENEKMLLRGFQDGVFSANAFNCFYIYL